MVEVLAGAVPCKENKSARLVGHIKRVDVYVVVGVPVVGIELVVSLGSVPYVLLVEVVRQNPRIGGVLNSRLGTVGVVVLFKLLPAVVASLIETPAYEDGAPVAVDIRVVLAAVHDPSLRPARVLGVAGAVGVHPQLLARPEKSVGFSLFDVDTVGRVVQVSLLRERRCKGLFHGGLVLAVLKRESQLLVERRAFVLLRIRQTVVGVRCQREHGGRENRRRCQRAKQSF